MQEARHALSNPDASVRGAVRMAHDMRRRLRSGLSERPLHPGHEDVSDAVALASFYTFPDTRAEDHADHLPWLIAAMPHFLHAPFEELYLPAVELEAFRPAPARVGAQRLSRV